MVKNLLIIALAVTFAPQAVAKVDPLIPLKDLFTNPVVVEPKISPDGDQLVTLASKGGVMNLKLIRLSDPKKGRFLTNEKTRSLVARTIDGSPAFQWAYDSRHVIYLNDHEGDENWVLYSVDTLGGGVRRLSPVSAVRTKVLKLSPHHPTRVLALVYKTKQNSNVTDPIPHVVEIDLSTGAAMEAESNPGFIGFVADDNLKVRVGVSYDGRTFEVFRKNLKSNEWVHLPRLSTAREPGKVLGFSSAQELLRIDSNGDKTAILSTGLITQESRVLAQSTTSDIEFAIVHPRDGKLLAWSDYFESRKWHAYAGELTTQADLSFLEKAAKEQDGAEIAVESQSLANDKWIVRFTRSNYPETYSLFERSNDGRRRLTQLFVATPALVGLPLSRMHSVVIKSKKYSPEDKQFDLVSYYSLPRWLDADGSGNLTGNKKVPLVVIVHGGPTDERAQLGFAPLLQWLTNRGYAVLLVNFRGSPGFGAAFLEAQNLEWGGKMHEDVLVQVAWATGRYTAASRAGGFADPKRIAIFGGSYGGYETWVAMTKSPEVFSCGAPVVGPANLLSFIANRPSDWNIDKLARMIGDPRTPEGVAHLKSRSPYFIVDTAKGIGPILIGQGARDDRVKQNEADTMYLKLRDKGSRVTYALFPDEGHGFVRQENNLAFYRMLESFFSSCLGGRSLAIGDEFKGSSVIVKGAHEIPNLKKALAPEQIGD